MVTACAPPEPAVTPQVGAMQLRRIDNTPADIAWCISHPGGAPEWHTEVINGQVVRFLACRIVA